MRTGSCLEAYGWDSLRIDGFWPVWFFKGCSKMAGCKAPCKDGSEEAMMSGSSEKPGSNALVLFFLFFFDGPLWGTPGRWLVLLSPVCRRFLPCGRSTCRVHIDLFSPSPVLIRPIRFFFILVPYYLIVPIEDELEFPLEYMGPGK